MSVQDSIIATTSFHKTPKKPFQIEKEQIQTIQLQQNSIQGVLKFIQDVIPKNIRWYSEYGDKLMQNAEKMRIQAMGQSLLCQDLYSLIMWLSQYFEIIGKMFSQNYVDISEEIESKLYRSICNFKEIKDTNFISESQRLLAKAVSSYTQMEKYKQDFEKSSKDAQDAIQKMKQAKTDPQLMYNLSVQEESDERAQKTVKYMEEKRVTFKYQQELLGKRNIELQDSLEKLNSQHWATIEQFIKDLKQSFEVFISIEQINYNNLSFVSPEKAKVIKNFKIKQDLILEIRQSEDSKLKKPNLIQIRQMIQDLQEGTFSYSTLAPYYQALQDTNDIYQLICDKWSKLSQALYNFFQDIYNVEKNMIKVFRELNISEKRKKEMYTLGLNYIMNEIFKSYETREKNHLNYFRYLESLLSKLDQVMKNQKQDEKAFLSSLQKTIKDAYSLNEKTIKNIQQIEKQKEKISFLLSTNFQQNTDDRQNTYFQALMQDYQQQGEILKEMHNNFKSVLIYSIDQILESVNIYKNQQTGHLNALYGVIVGLTSYEETFIYQMQILQKEFHSFLKDLDDKLIIQQLKGQIHGETLLHNDKHDQIELYKEDIIFVEKEEKTEEFSPFENEQNINEEYFSNKDEPLSEKQSIEQNSSDERSKEQRRQSAIVEDKDILEIKKQMNLKTPAQSFAFSNQNNNNIIKSISPQNIINMETNEMFDEETKQEIEKIKVNMLSNNTNNVEQDSGSYSPNTKLLIEKFNVMEEGEKFLESFGCAISLRILLQGRMYITNKKVYFHSFFNDKTIFGKDTKIVMPFKIVKKFEKRYNALIFDNSISIHTKDNKEYFFTSYVWRDSCFDLLQKQFDAIHSDQERSGSINSQNSKGGQGNSAEYQMNRSQQEEEEEFKNTEQNGEIEMQDNKGISQRVFNEKELLSQYDNATIELTDEFRSIEEQRMKQVISSFNEFDNFPWLMFNIELDCSIKHFAQTYLNVDKKFKEIKNRCLQHALEEDTLENIKISYNPPKGIQMPQFFQNMSQPQPSPSEFKNWPLSGQFISKKMHQPLKPKMMQPKQNEVEETFDIFYVSPRKIIRRGLVESFGFTYADCFKLENKLTIEQSCDSPFKTQIKLEFRINFIKNVRFFQSMIIKESEKSLRDGLENHYKEKLIEYIHLLKEPMKQRFLREAKRKQQIQQSEVKDNKEEDNIQNNENEENKEEEELIDQEEYQDSLDKDQNERINIEQAKKLQQLEIDKQELIKKVDMLNKVVYGILFINLLILLVVLFK